MHCVIIAFTIINEAALPNSPRGNHTVAIINAMEDYETLSESLMDISNEIKEIHSIEINEVQYRVEWFFTADLKFLALCSGIEAANSRFACIWCKCPSESRYNTSQKWSVTNIEEGARTIDEIQELPKLSKNKDTEKYGCIRQPLFPSIPIDHIIPDTLHLLLQVCDVLINFLICSLRHLDGLKKNKSSLNFDKYVTFLNKTCKVSFHTYTDNQSKELKWRDLTDPEKIKLFENINLEELFPDMPNVKRIQDIWSKFYGIYKSLEAVSQPAHQQYKSYDVAYYSG